MTRFFSWLLILAGIIIICLTQRGEMDAQLVTLSSKPEPASTVLTLMVTEKRPSNPMPTPVPERAPKPVRIVIPAIGVDAPVVEVGVKIIKTEKGTLAQWETADYAAGHHSTSANPGEKGNIVISGHNNIKGKVFQRLWQLKPGDNVFLYNAEGKVFAYEVKEILLVQEKGVSEEQRRANAKYIEPTPDETLTLISCWPPHGNSHRVIVIAKPVKRPLLRRNVIN